MIVCKNPNQMNNPVDPAVFPGWDETLAASDQYSIFHSSPWAKVLHETYGYAPRYFLTRSGERFNLLVPVMEVSSKLTGRRGVSLPFSDYCAPILPEGVPPIQLMENLAQFGRRAGWRYVEIRADRPMFEDVAPYETFQGHFLPLQPDTDPIFRTFRKATQRNVKKAVKSGVVVSFHTSAYAVKEYYRLHCLTRKRHGLPPQPFFFFSRIHKHILAPGKGFIALAEHGHRNIAGAVYLTFHRQSVYKFGAIDLDYSALNPFYLVMWEAIRRLAESGSAGLCFGRTEPENKGLIQFKDGWGGEKRTIHYYRYDLKRKNFMEKPATRNPEDSRINRIFSRTPIPFLQLAGNILYRHMG